MTIRLWMAPPNYPNKHVGIYKRATNDSYESVKFFEGQPVNLDHEIRFVFDRSPLDRLAKFGCLWTNINPPLVNGIIGELLDRGTAGDCQLFRAHIIAKDGETHDYYLVNVSCSVRCLDFERSVIDSYWNDGRPRGISKLRFKPDGCMQKHTIARLEEYIPTIVVSESLFEALSRLKYPGLHFELDSAGDGKRV